MAAAPPVGQTCYICQAYFADPVKLGLHIAACYQGAKVTDPNVPHPTDIVSAQRYSEFMRHKAMVEAQKRLEANARKVSFLTADEFGALRNQLTGVSAPTVAAGSRAPAPPSQNVDYRRFKRPATSGGSTSQPATTPSATPRPAAAPAVACGSPVKHARQQRRTDRHDSADPTSAGPQPPAPGSSGTGITLLRQELQCELLKLREIVAEEQALLAFRKQQLEAEQDARGAPHALRREHHAEEKDENEDAPTTACPKCGGLFGGRGFAVHALRCGRDGTSDFTYSKDAKLGGNAMARPGPSSGASATDAPPPATGRDAQWTQFMVTYPRPVLEERPKTAAQRAAEVQAKRQAERPYALHDNPDVTRVACAKCGRFFATERVERHEATCVARPRR